ncbi:hypothetical protein DB347_17040 [Opitutaceae bacterium EW11]|nr:hypothetical protein DB347_17040 [Opitutaceae bacterium EW11]
MPAIKIHLEDEEYAPICRLADQLHLSTEDIAYAAINRLMMQSTDTEIRADIRQTHAWRGSNLPRWGDSARSVHAYEGKADDHSVPHEN